MDTPTTFEELVEFRARTLWLQLKDCTEDVLSDKANPSVKYLEKIFQRDREDYKRFARATIIAEIEAGLLVVPAEATEEMMRRMSAMSIDVKAEDLARQRWKAALAAGALRPEEEE